MSQNKTPTSGTKPAVGKTKLKSPKKRKKGRAGDGPPTRLRLPSGQDVIVELEYPNDLTIDWRDSQGRERPDKTKGKPLTCRGTRLRLQFPSGEVLEGVSKCAPEDNFDRYEGKRDTFLQICRQDDDQATQGIGAEKVRRINLARHYLNKTLHAAGFVAEADKIDKILDNKLATLDYRDLRKLLLPPEDRRALMMYLCPKFAQRMTDDDDNPLPSFTILKDQKDDPASQ